MPPKKEEGGEIAEKRGGQNIEFINDFSNKYNYTIMHDTSSPENWKKLN